MEITDEILSWIISTTPGNAAVYRICGQRVETLYSSPSLPLLNGMTREEYDEITRESASAVVVPEDLPRLMQAVHECVETGKPLDFNYRTVHKRLGFDWVHANACLCGERDGCPVLITTYSNASVETNIYQNLLDHSNSMVFVCDCETHELLYANEAAKTRRSGTGDIVPGVKCYTYIQGLDAPCRDCFLMRRDKKAPLDEKRYDPQHGTWSRVNGEFVNWCGHAAFVHYISDVTESESRQAQLLNVLSADELLVEEMQILNGAGGISERLDRLLQTVGRFFKADRAYLCENEPDGKTISNTHEWCSGDVTPQIDNLQGVDLRYIAGWLPQFDRREPVIVPDIEKIKTEQRETYEVMIAQNIHSFVEAPLLTEGRFTGFIGLDNPAADMLDHSADVLMTLAYAVANAIVRAAGEQALRSAGQRYELAVEGAALGVWEYHIREHRLSNPNRRLQQIGLPPVMEDFPAAILPLTLESDREKLLALYRRVDAGEPDLSADLWMKWQPDAAPVCEHIVYSVVRDENGAPETAYGISIDVTAQKREQEKFHQALQETLTANPDALGTLWVNLTQNSCGEGHSASPVFVSTVSAATVDELVDNVTAEIPSESERAAFREKFSCEKLLRAFQSGQSDFQLEYRRLGENGKPFWLRTYIRMLRNPDTGDVEGVMYSLDISREKRLDEIFRIITDQEYDLIALVHADTREVEAVHLSDTLPQAYREMLPASGAVRDLDEYRRNAMERWLDPEDREKYRQNSEPAYYRALMDRTGHSEFTLREHFPDKGQTWRRFQHYYLDGDRDTILVIESDVTAALLQQQRELEKERALRMQAITANAAKSEFLSRMSHDIRTPLNGIIGMTYIATEQENPPKTEDCLAKIGTSSKFLLGLVNDILDMSKAESGKIELHPEPYQIDDFRSYIDAVIKPLCDDKNQTLLFETAPIAGCIPVMDIMRINQIYFNLLSNAVKYTPEGGTIRVGVEEKLLDAEKLRITVTVSDNGIGMSEEFQQILFDPFTQENRNDVSEMRGSGLGLAIVKKLIDAMDGTITVQSELGKGTCFTFTIDHRYIRADRQTETRRTETADYSILAGKHVLLCEDHPLNQEIAKALLEEKGMLTELAENGEEGVASFRRSAVGFYDVVLMDIRMPVMDGYEATRELRALPRPDAADVPILAMTADAFTDDIQKCLDAGMNGHIAKPIDPALLYETLCAALQGRK